MKWFLTIFILFSGWVLSQPLAEMRGIKLTNVDSNVMFSDGGIARAMDFLAETGINTVLCVVWNSNGADGDYTLYPSAVMDQYFGKSIHPAFSGRDALQRVLIEAHRNGIEVLPWFEMGFSTSYSQNGGHILQKYPDWALKDSNGNLIVKNGFDWMSAINPEVRDFILALTREVAENYDIDGVEYSDRIPAMPVEGGYDSVTVAIYRSEHNGQNPPADFRDANWMRWRADKLSKFYQMAHDTIKSVAAHLKVASSPSVFPWSYQEYLQDPKSWMEDGIAEEVIPQLYRYSLSDYVFTLDNSLANYPNHRDVYFAGMLIRLGNYVIDPGYLLSAMAANRQRNVPGEIFFFYEGLRANNDRLADTLKATFYSEPAVSPGRGNNIWRPKATILNEDEPGVSLSGDWQTETGIDGFRPGVLLTNSSNYAAIEYKMDVPFAAWFDVYPYVVSGPLAAKQARHVVYHNGDSTEIVVDQTAFSERGWQPIATVYLQPGEQTVLKIDNSLTAAGQTLTADAAMMMINRKQSPDVLVGIAEPDQGQSELPKNFRLRQNYPNPFNPETTIEFALSQTANVQLDIVDITGKRVSKLVDETKMPGVYRETWHAGDYASGVYFYRLQTDGAFADARKMVLLK